MLFLGGNEHSVKVSSNSEMVRAGVLFENFGDYRELILKSSADIKVYVQSRHCPNSHTRYLTMQSITNFRSALLLDLNKEELMSC